MWTCTSFAMPVRILSFTQTTKNNTLFFARHLAVTSKHLGMLFSHPLHQADRISGNFNTFKTSFKVSFHQQRGLPIRHTWPTLLFQPTWTLQPINQLTRTFLAPTDLHQGGIHGITDRVILIYALALVSKNSRARQHHLLFPHRGRLHGKPTTMFDLYKYKRNTHRRKPNNYKRWED
jgi:hypothetical protein